MKDLEFRETSLEDLKAFPDPVRREAGFQLDRGQNGLVPADWKPMPAVGSGAQEIRLRDEGGVFRIIYVAKFADAIYVLHCFQKKTQKTLQRDIQIAKSRYSALVAELKK